MANRFWVGSVSGNWSDISNWSATSGGASGVSVPVSVDDVFFDSGGSGIATLDVIIDVNDLTIGSDFNGTVDGGLNFSHTVNNDLTVSQGKLLFGTGVWTIVGQSFYDYDGDVCLDTENFFISAGVEVSDLDIDFNFTFDTRGKLEVDFGFTFDFAQEVFYWYQVEGECLIAQCEFAGFDPNDPICLTSGQVPGFVDSLGRPAQVTGQSFIKTVFARNVEEVCRAIRADVGFNEVFWPVRRIARFSRPVLTEDIEEQIAAGIDHSCNVMIDEDFCVIPECLDYCLDERLTTEFYVDIVVFAIDNLFLYEASGGFELGGEASLFEPVTGDAVLTIAGEVDVQSSGHSFASDGIGLELGGEATIQSDYFEYEGSGGFEVGGEVDVVSPFFTYVSDGDIIEAGGDILISGFVLSYDSFFVLLTLGGVVDLFASNLVFDSALAELTVGGESSFAGDRVADGDVELEFSAEANTISPNHTFVSDGDGIETDITHAVGRDFEVLTNLEFVPTTVPFNVIFFGPAEAPLEIDGEADVVSPAYSWEGTGGFEIAGDAIVESSDLGLFEVEMGIIESLTLLEVAFGVDLDLPEVSGTGSEDVFTDCGCNPSTRQLEFRHGLDNANVLAQFLSRNGFTLPTLFNLTFNERDSVWREAFSFVGSGATEGQNERWNILFEWRCDPDSDLQNRWVLSILVRRLNLVTAEDFDTRLLFYFNTSLVCPFGAIGIGFSIDTSNPGQAFISGEFVSDVNNVFFDEIGLFLGEFWRANPGLPISVTVTTTPEEVNRFDISPIFPENQFLFLRAL